MDLTKHIVIEDGIVETFTRKISEASAEGFVVVASNVSYIRHDMGGHVHYESLFYALMAKTSVSQPISDTFTHHKILEELNEIKFELKDIANNIKYLGD